jgi:hypothetical protein
MLLNMWIELKVLCKQAVADLIPILARQLVRGRPQCSLLVLDSPQFVLYKTDKLILHFVLFGHQVTTPQNPRRWAFVYSRMLPWLRQLSLMRASVY